MGKEGKLLPGKMRNWWKVFTGVLGGGYQFWEAATKPVRFGRDIPWGGRLEPVMKRVG